MAFRDLHQAQHQRIAALESELEGAKREIATLRQARRPRATPHTERETDTHTEVGATPQRPLDASDDTWAIAAMIAGGTALLLRLIWVLVAQ